MKRRRPALSQRAANDPSTLASNSSGVHASARRATKTKSSLCVMFSTALVLGAHVASSLAATAIDDYTPSAELQALIDKLRGDDFRLMRWDATRHTLLEQTKGGACDELPLIMGQLVSSTSERTRDRESKEWQTMACEYATFCITDNPEHRQRLAEVDGIHPAIVKLLSENDGSPLLSATASHVIYIATFANKENHQGFYEAGSVGALSSIINSDAASPLQHMWAAAALQNLAASYCDTPGNGRCSWDWTEHDSTHVTVEDEVLSDGVLVRKEALSSDKLVSRLVHLACRGPVHGTMRNDNPFPGHNARAVKHGDAANIVPWAAAGALKNIALEPEGAAMLRKDTVCFCRLAHSHDWLEQNKGEGILHHIRPDEPCWFAREGKEDDYAHGDLCVDREFLDDEGYRCDDYGDATAEECRATDRMDASRAASAACCGCGGGDKYGDSLRHEL